VREPGDRSGHAWLDLVFVFTITQLTSVLVSHPSLLGFAQVALMLGVIWWMYGGDAWFTNAVPADRPTAVPEGP
jgi:low temperature requirement protein LtrA